MVGGKRKPGGGITGVITAKEVVRHAYEQIHAKAVKAAGVDKDARGNKRHVSSHGERAGFITENLDAGVPAEMIRPITGHAEGSTVFFRYYRSAHRWDGHNPLRRTRKVLVARRDAAAKKPGRGR
jgi:integrase